MTISAGFDIDVVVSRILVAPHVCMPIIWWFCVTMCPWDCVLNTEINMYYFVSRYSPQLYKSTSSQAQLTEKSQRDVKCSRSATSAVVNDMSVQGRSISAGLSGGGVG